MKRWFIDAKWKFFKRPKDIPWGRKKFIEFGYTPYRKPRKHDRDDYGDEEMFYIWIFNNFGITIKPYNPEFDWLTKYPHNR